MESMMLGSNERFVTYDEKTLRSHNYILSMSMTSCLVDQISSYLSSQGTITAYEVQVIRSQFTGMQKASQLLQTLIRKGRKACQLFYRALECSDPMLFERATGSPAKCPTLEIPSLQESSSPETKKAAPTYVINIKDSTVTHCIFGSHNEQWVTRDQQGAPPLGFELGRPEPGVGSRCDQQRAAQATPEPVDIDINHSKVKYLTIGDDCTLIVQEEPECIELE